MADGGWWMMDGGSRMMDSRKWMVVGGKWMMRDRRRSAGLRGGLLAREGASC